MIKFVVEKGKDPDLEEPQDINTTEQKNRLLMFKWQEQIVGQTVFTTEQYIKYVSIEAVL